MKSYLALGVSEALALKGALLLYEGRNRTFAVWHDAKPGVGEGAHLGEAQTLTASGDV